MPSPPVIDQLLLSGQDTVQKFCDKAIDSTNAREASIVQIELIKDTRTLEEQWWRHETLVFTIVHDAKERVLFFERGRPADPEPLLKFAWAGFRGKAEDLMEFFEPDSDDPRYRDTIAHATRVFRVLLQRNRVSLLNLTEIIKNGPYYDGYSQYQLTSANCWSWARGLLLDIALTQYKSIMHAVLYPDKEHPTSMTAEELQVCLLTQYGAFGGLLLRITSGKSIAFIPPERNSLTPCLAAAQSDTLSNVKWQRVEDRIRFRLVRGVLCVYTVLSLFLWLREFCIGPSNWVTSFRRLVVHPDKVLDDKGEDVTRTPLPPNFLNLLPSHRGLDPLVAQSLCIPGRYPLTFIIPSIRQTSAVSSIHIYISIGIQDEEHEFPAPFILRTGIVTCSAMRKGSDGNLLEVGTPIDIELRAASLDPNSKPAETTIKYYHSVARIDGEDRFAKQMRPGDVIVIWAHGSQKQILHPRFASLKVVARNFAVGPMEVGMIFGLWLRGPEVYKQLPLIHLILALSSVLFYLMTSHFEEYVWSSLTRVISTVFAKSGPLPLPPDDNSVLRFTLPDFNDHCEKPGQEVLSSPLKNISLVQTKANHVTLTIEFEDLATTYVAEILEPPQRYDWKHYMSFMATSHRLERSTVKVFRKHTTGNFEGSVHTVADQFGADAVFRVQLEYEGTGIPFARIVELLQKAQGRYWFFFWCNEKEWSWPIWTVRALASSATRVSIDGLGESLACSPEEADVYLGRIWSKWRAAYIYEYGTAGWFKDATFTLKKTRAMYLIGLVVLLAHAR
ncbi:hypothetical protein D9611_013783 [Ephemerocybe angulata]|uniref:Uncharacterized protein n=1 Tax=Ephemerocybe angulata TaxID=980116 RepID=A0A8H5FFC1_9AGAR|nr:hypothetical protein D9611_013783 [Tulosesus angulatus]